MKYKVDGEIFDTIDDVLDYCIDDDYHWDDDYFKEWVNDRYGYITIYGEDFDAYDILNEMNQDILTDLKEDFCDDQNDVDRRNTEYDLQNAEAGYCITCQRYEIEVIEDEEETGDFDGDETRPCSIEEVRLYLEEQQILKDMAEAENKKNENDMMTLFQVIK